MKYRVYLKKFWTACNGQSIYCTLDDSTKPFIKNDSIVELKTTKKNLATAIRQTNFNRTGCHYKFYELMRHNKKDLLQIATAFRLLHLRE